jgi:predicted phosphoribosyltransferase
MAQHFHDRFDAGRVLATKLVVHARRGDVLVLALPRGGALVVFEVAKTLRPPLAAPVPSRSVTMPTRTVRRLAQPSLEGRS